jgi:hypothetical protein
MAALAIGLINFGPTFVKTMLAATGASTSTTSPSPTPSATTTAASPEPSSTPSPTPSPVPDGLNHTDSTHPVDWSFLPSTLGVLAATATATGLVYLAWRTVSTQRDRRRDAATKRSAQQQRWAIGERSLAETSTHVMEFETDPESVYFTRPLLADVSEPATAAFYTALAEAHALCIDTVPTDDQQITAFVTAATNAQRAFTAANDNALRKARLGVIHGDRKLTRDQTRKLGQARKLLAQALDPANTPELATHAHAKVQELIDDVGLIVPERLTATTVRSIAALHKAALPAGSAR